MNGGEEPKDLKSWVRKRFPDLSAAEIRLLVNAELGKSESHWGTDTAPAVIEEDWPTLSQRKREPKHCVRAELIRFLCTDREAHKLIDPRGIHVRDVWIERRAARERIEQQRDDLDIDLDSTTIPFSLYFRNCVIPGGVQMRDASTKFVAFHQSHIGELRFDRVTVKGILLLNNNRVRRPVVVRQAEIEGSLILANSSVDYGNEARKTSCIEGNKEPGDRSEYDIDISWTSVENQLDLSGVAVTGRISLEQASVGSLKDSLAIYQDGMPPALRGFEYTVLENACSIDKRLEIWLADARVQGYRQPFDELCKWLRSDGHEMDAVRVAMAREDMTWRIRREAAKPYRGSIQRAISGPYRGLSGYGFRPHRLAAWFAAAYAIGVFVFAAAHADAVIKPRNGKDQSFQAWIYTADVMLPVASLGPDKDWIVEPSPTARHVAIGPIQIVRLDHLAIGARVFLKLFGWLSGILLIAAVTRRMVRSD